MVTKDERPLSMIEAKWSEATLSPHFKIFSKQLPFDLQKVQIVKELKKETMFPDGCEIRKASQWLSQMPIGLR